MQHFPPSCQLTSSRRQISTWSFLAMSSDSSLYFSISSLVCLIFFLRTSRRLLPCTCVMMSPDDSDCVGRAHSTDWQYWCQYVNMDSAGPPCPNSSLPCHRYWHMLVFTPNILYTGLGLKSERSLRDSPPHGEALLHLWRISPPPEGSCLVSARHAATHQ